MADEPDSLVLQLLRDILRDMREQRTLGPCRPYWGRGVRQSRARQE